MAVTARYLKAAFRGEDNEDADMGWLMVADAIDCLRALRAGGGKA